MTNPPPRKRFQIHLSTAIVMMFVAGVIIWLNTTPRHVGYWAQSWFYNADRKPHDYKVLARGYPLPMHIELEEDFSGFSPTEMVSPSTLHDQTTVGIIVDLVLALAILFAVCFLCEWLIRRRSQT